MDINILHIRNVVCHRCILTVKDILLRNKIRFNDVLLGEVELTEELSKDQLEILDEEFKKVGFEIIEGKNDRVVNKIKSIIIEGVYEDKNFSNKNLSAILSERLHLEYSHLSSMFSAVEGQSIQNFQNKIKTERIKELLEYEEFSISEIAYSLGYGNAAYLSTSFKKTTGFTPSQYRSLHKKERKNLDAV